MDILVCTISDRAARGEYSDRSGPRIEVLLKEALPHSCVKRNLISDDPNELREVLRSNSGMNVIITTGGTGLGPRDQAPEVTGELCERLVPGIPEFLRQKSLEQTQNAVLSRGTAGLIGATLVVNLPGSLKAADFCIRQLLQVLPHALHMIKGEGHE